MQTGLNTLIYITCLSAHGHVINPSATSARDNISLGNRTGHEDLTICHSARFFVACRRCGS
jgi:hypothetical protein